MSCDPVVLAAKLNEAENALGRAITAAKKNNLPKVWTDTNAGIAFAKEALAMCHDEVPHEHEHPAPTPTPSPTPTPTPTPAPSLWIRADSITPIASNFDVNAWLGTARLHTDGDSGVDEGAFRLSGVPGQLLYDDPVVYPGRPGAAHLHMFYGNLLANAHSTYESLRADGRSTTDSDMINRSAYWIPALQEADRFVKLPSHITMYYKRKPASSPWFAANGLIPADIPAGFKMVFGNNYNADPLPFANARPHLHASFALFRNNAVVINSQPDLTTILPYAQVGDDIYASLTTPTFWDGIHVDSPNHRSHVRYGYTTYQNPAIVVDPAFRHVLPTMTQRFRFTVTPEDKPMDWIFSSDLMMGTKPGETFHGDYMEAWDPDIRTAWHRNAIDRALNCSGCDLGNGKAGRRHPTFSFDYTPTLVPIPAKGAST